MALGLLAAACSDDDGGEVRSEDDDASASASEAADTGSASAPAECRPYGDASTADTTVGMTLAEFSYEMDETTVPAGTITFEGENIGALDHEFVLAEGTDIPTDDEGAPDEDALGERLLGEVGAFPGQGETCTGTWTLEPGEYTFFCAITEADGTNHFAEGMEISFTVE